MGDAVTELRCLLPGRPSGPQMTPAWCSWAGGTSPSAWGCGTAPTAGECLSSPATPKPWGTPSPPRSDSPPLPGRSALFYVDLTGGNCGEWLAPRPHWCPGPLQPLSVPSSPCRAALGGHQGRVVPAAQPRPVPHRLPGEQRPGPPPAVQPPPHGEQLGPKTCPGGSEGAGGQGGAAPTRMGRMRPAKPPRPMCPAVRLVHRAHPHRAGGRAAAGVG